MYSQCYFLNKKDNTTGQEQTPVEIGAVVKRTAIGHFRKIKEKILLK